MKVLYITATGASDPTRASIPFHLAANGSAAKGHETSIVFAGDAAELLIEGKVDEVAGLGLPSLKELWERVVEHSIPVYV